MGRAEEFLADVIAIVAEVCVCPSGTISPHFFCVSQVKDLPPPPPGTEEGGDVQIYGLTGSVPAGCVADLLNAYIDVTLKL